MYFQGETVRNSHLYHGGRGARRIDCGSFFEKVGCDPDIVDKKDGTTQNLQVDQVSCRERISDSEQSQCDGRDDEPYLLERSLYPTQGGP